MSRKAAREVAMKLLYEKDMSSNYSKESLNNMKREFNISKGSSKYIDDIIFGVDENLDQIDEYIKKHVQHWRFDRIAKLDLAILRLAIYEMMWIEDIPYKVSINEAVELSKVYGSKNSSSFINGVLGSIVRLETTQGGEME